MRRESSVIDLKSSLNAAGCTPKAHSSWGYPQCYRGDLEDDGTPRLGLRGFIRLSKAANCGWERTWSNAGSWWRCKIQPERSSKAFSSHSSVSSFEDRELIAKATK